MKSVIQLAILFFTIALPQVSACQVNARILSKEFNVCMDAVPGADIKHRSVIDVDLFDITLNGAHAVVAIDPLGIGTYNRLISELNIEGRKYRGDGIVVFAEIYDGDRLVVIGRRDQKGKYSSSWVYITFDKADEKTSQVLIGKLVKSIRACS